jgi:hypothetical protein
MEKPTGGFKSVLRLMSTETLDGIPSSVSNLILENIGTNAPTNVVSALLSYSKKGFLNFPTLSSPCDLKKGPKETEPSRFNASYKAVGLEIK